MKPSNLLVICATVVIAVALIATSVVLSSSYSTCTYQANGDAASCTWVGLR